MNAAHANTVGKSELAKLLGWARSRLDRCIDRDPAFPIVRKGDRGGGWLFDVDQVRAHVGVAATVKCRPRANRKTTAWNSGRATPAARATVGKKELCALLNWSRTRLDHRLREDPGFPVVRIGDQLGGWEFDPVAVKAHLDGKPAQVARSAVDLAQLRDAVAPPLPAQQTPSMSSRDRRSAHHAGEASARQRKDAAQAEMLELKLGVERDKYILREDVRRALADGFIHLRAHLERLPERIVSEFEMPQTAIAWLRRYLDDARTEMVRDLEKLYAEPSSDAPSKGT